MSEPVSTIGENEKRIGAVGVRQGMGHTERTTIVPSNTPTSQREKVLDKEISTAEVTGNIHTIIQTHPSQKNPNAEQVSTTRIRGNTTEIHQTTQPPSPFHKPLLKTSRPASIRKTA